MNNFSFAKNNRNFGVNVNSTYDVFSNDIYIGSLILRGGEYEEVEDVNGPKYKNAGKRIIRKLKRILWQPVPSFCNKNNWNYLQCSYSMKDAAMVLIEEHKSYKNKNNAV